MTTLAQGRSVTEWIIEINGEWSRVVENAVHGFVALGEILIQAKASLPHGQWQPMVEKQLKFSPQTARTFMRIARFVRKAKHPHVNVLDLLPPDYATIDQIIRLEPPALKRFIENGTITPALRRNELQRVLNDEKVKADKERVENLRPRPGRYKTLIVDPAWEYEAYSESVNAKAGYVRQSMDELYALGMKQWAESDCHLWCWTTNGYMRKSIDLVEHWGFRFREILTWVKPQIGRGQYLRGATEHALFCTLGDLPAKSSDIPSFFMAKRGEHSEKPEEFYDIVRKMCWEPYGEAYQRKFRPDFTNLFMSGEPLQAAV